MSADRASHRCGQASENSCGDGRASISRNAFGLTRSGAKTKLLAWARSFSSPTAKLWRGFAAAAGGRGKMCLERRSTALSQRPVIVRRVEQAIGDQHLMWMHAPAIASARAKVAESTKRPSRKAYSERRKAPEAWCARCLPDRNDPATAETGMPPSILP